jgi:hypothetical protein
VFSSIIALLFLLLHQAMKQTKLIVLTHAKTSSICSNRLLL